MGLGSVGMHLGQQERSYSRANDLFAHGYFDIIWQSVALARSIDLLLLSLYTADQRDSQLDFYIPFLNPFDVKYGQRAI